MSSDPSFRIASDAASHPSHRSPDVVPRRCTLDGFVDEVSRADGIGLIDVDAFTTLVVRTENSVYQVTILKPHAREVLVQGGAFFPVRTKACLNGSSFGGSCLKLGWVGLGLRMEFHTEDRRWCTDPAPSVSHDRPPGPRGDSRCMIST